MDAPSSVLVSRRFTTGEAPAARRASVFRHHMANAFSVGLDVRPVGASDLQCTVDGYWGAALRFAALRFSPHVTEPARLPADESALLISLHREGRAFVSQDGRESELSAGDLFVLNPGRPFMIETGEILTTSLYMAPGAARALIPEIDRYTAMAIPTEAGPGALFRAFLDELFRTAPHLDARAADRVCDTIPFMLATALGAVEPAATLAPNRARSAHKQRVLRFVRENLQNPNLNPALIASAVGLSPRYVYDLFADEDASLMRRVWRDRLERCRSDLSVPQMAMRSIGEIAFGWGFSDMAHFSKAFRQQFGVSPREWRAGGRA